MLPYFRYDGLELSSECSASISLTLYVKYYSFASMNYVLTVSSILLTLAKTQTVKIPDSGL